MEESVNITLARYNDLMADHFELQQVNSTLHNMQEFNDRLEAAIIDYIATNTKYGHYDWKLREEFSEIISLLGLEDHNWQQYEPNETKRSSAMEVFEAEKEKFNTMQEANE